MASLEGMCHILMFIFNVSKRLYHIQIDYLDIIIVYSYKMLGKRQISKNFDISRVH